MPTTPSALRRFAAFVATTFVSLVAAAAASAMPLVPEGDPPIKVRNVHQTAESMAAAGSRGPSGIDWSTAAVSAAYAAAIVLVILAVAFAALRARNRHRSSATALS